MVMRVNISTGRETGLYEITIFVPFFLEIFLVDIGEK